MSDGRRAKMQHGFCICIYVAVFMIYLLRLRRSSAFDQEETMHEEGQVRTLTKKGGGGGMTNDNSLQAGAKFC